MGAVLLVKQADEIELKTVAELAARLWKEASASELYSEFNELAKKGEAVFFLKYCGEIPVGFAQCQLRNDYVEGCDTSPVGYLEGIYVAEEYRHRGYASELLRACEEWSKSNGCREFASDCELNNTASHGFHMNTGFEEVNRIICFKKRLY